MTGKRLKLNPTAAPRSPLAVKPLLSLSDGKAAEGRSGFPHGYLKTSLRSCRFIFPGRDRSLLSHCCQTCGAAACGNPPRTNRPIVQAPHFTCLQDKSQGHVEDFYNSHCGVRYRGLFQHNTTANKSAFVYFFFNIVRGGRRAETRAASSRLPVT